MHRFAKTAVVAGLTGALSVSAAWAGVGLVPVPLPEPVEKVTAPLLPGAAEPAAAPAAAAPADLPSLSGAQVLVGAAKGNLLPRPEDMQDRFPGARWETDRAKCARLDPAFLQQLATNTAEEVDHLVSAGSPWPENPNCLYMGGYGLGPMNPITSFDETLGLWVRALAISDGEDLLVLTVIDAEGWLWDYANKCDDCGIKQIGEALAADPELAARGMKPESFNLHATHSHTAMDFLGGWGFVPDWYMAQATDTIKQTVRSAVLQMEPAVLEVGQAEAREHNGERRGTYRSAEESELTWLRAVSVGNGQSSSSAQGKPRVLATLGAFAAHPVTENAGSGVAHPDWPGWFAKAAEDRFGGIGMHFMTGLGNVTGAKNHRVNEDGSVRRSTGEELVDLIAPVGQGRPVDSPDLRLAATTFRQPVTNAPLDALGTPGFFDRKFDLTPASVRTGKNPDSAPCASAAPQSVELPVRAFAIGDDVVITTGPGELFSNLTNTIKEKSPQHVVFPLAQINDSLGYMPQSFELHPVGQQGLGFVAGGQVFVNYEDSYAIDRCVGDMVLETTLGLLGSVR